MNTTRRTPWMFACTSVLLSTLLGLPATAQLRQPGEPASARAGLPTDLPTIVLEEPDIDAWLADDEAGPDRPFRYGAVIDTSLSIEKLGRWDTVAATGELVWRLSIASPGALSLGVMFSHFDLPAGAQVFLYDPDRTYVLGAYTEANEKHNGALAVQPVPGDRVVIEYVQPRDAAVPKLVVGEVIHAFRDLFPDDEDDTLAVSCLVDINCPAGANYQDVKRAIVRLTGGAGSCSGMLVNNTAEDGTPYVMTARHCGDMTNAVVFFRYERSGCGTGSFPNTFTVSGLTLLASSLPYDARLYLLSQPPPPSHEPFYAGWTLDDVVSAPGVCISHPGGGPKKISIDNQAPMGGSTRWTVSFDIGMIEPGSSGSPLLDHRQRILGVASSTAGSCAANISQYGRFDRFYTSKDLDVFLDPLGWGLSGIDGYDPFSSYVTAYNGTGVNPELFVAATLPILGTTFSLDVDTSGHPGTTLTLVVGYTAPAEGATFAFGELLVDATSTALFSSVSSAGAGLSRHDLPLPNTPNLVGRVGYLQAFLFGGGLTATNGVKAVLGQ